MRKYEFENAFRLAEEELKSLEIEAGLELMFLEKRTKSVESGWIFFYNSKEFVLGGNPMAELAGNGPIFVSKEGVVYILPSSVAWEESIKDLR